MTAISEASWTSWPVEARVRLLASLLEARWTCDRPDCDGAEHGPGFDVATRTAFGRNLVLHGRVEQRLPGGDWAVWYLQGGRGSGKTRTGAETLRRWILETEPGDWAIIAPTFGDARDVCVTGESGLLQALGAAVSSWNVSTGEVVAVNGSRVFLDGANDGALRIQGKNLRGAWCDEVGLWSYGWRRAWEESLRPAVRKAPGLIVATGTPKAGHGLVRLLLEDERTAVTRMRTIDNVRNLHPATVAELYRLYEGKRLGRQELDAEFLEDVEGALWSLAQIEALRVDRHPQLARIVVGVDPNTTSGETADHAGIVVAGMGYSDKHGYVLEDRTQVSGGPLAWAQAAVDAFHDWKADRIVAEANQGGEMVELTIKHVDPHVPVKLVRASQGKRTRAEPVAALYEGNESNPPVVHHVGSEFVELEKEMASWTPEAPSPNRMDALVWALWELKLWNPPSVGRGSHVARGDIPGITEIGAGLSDY